MGVFEAMHSEESKLSTEKMQGDVQQHGNRFGEGREGPAWLSNFVHSPDYFLYCDCAVHSTKRDKKFFCINCMEGPMCMFKCENAHAKHSSLQVRMASHEYSIKVDDIRAFVNLSKIQFFYINNRHIVFIQSRTKQPTRVEAPSHCQICDRSLMDVPARFCSIECKLEAIKNPQGPEDLQLSLSNDGSNIVYGHEATGRLGVGNQHLHYVGQPRGKKNSPVKVQCKKSKKNHLARRRQGFHIQVVANDYGLSVPPDLTVNVVKCDTSSCRSEALMSEVHHKFRRKNPNPHKSPLW